MHIKVYLPLQQIIIMEDKIRKEVEALFNNNYISLDILDKAGTEEKEGYLSLNILDKPLQREKCLHLSPMMHCNVGGLTHLGCMDPIFHNHCKFKLLYEKKHKTR